jgi:hypothetical protein
VWSHGLARKPDGDMCIDEWWTRTLQNLPKDQRRTKVAVSMYTFWNLWKERNRRTFEGKEAEPATVLQLVKDEANLCFQACGTRRSISFLRYTFSFLERVLLIFM